jgi:riboflavin synthase
MSDVALGDSIAVSGVCLTVIAFDTGSFDADVSLETLRCTKLGDLNKGDPVNLEKALTPETRLGGHIVSGHVDGVGEVVSRKPEGNSVHFKIRAPSELSKYIAAKGSITIDGTSLTVNAINADVFDLNIVPHTLQETTMDSFQAGTRVNLEVDVIARYLERLLLGDASGEAGVSRELLSEYGFIK